MNKVNIYLLLFNDSGMESDLLVLDQYFYLSNITELKTQAGVKISEMCHQLLIYFH